VRVCVCGRKKARVGGTEQGKYVAEGEGV